ncbi:T9SS type A sorting domain-containing protein [Microscilla marina]|uniref:PKD domain-containing protein n=1 Tax=Microscilla marina ATCC 23134 TaxID=313606 RepID=A1ZXK7_MICM2|nr:T9SS type A sorting domain-containing protein [Microscilla marina]EAY24882.1 hypothetical protein M23134_05857 [Microscilla marina ATCC 23134]
MFNQYKIKYPKGSARSALVFGVLVKVSLVVTTAVVALFVAWWGGNTMKDLTNESFSQKESSTRPTKVSLFFTPDTSRNTSTPLAVAQQLTNGSAVATQAKYSSQVGTSEGAPIFAGRFRLGMNAHQPLTILGKKHLLVGEEAVYKIKGASEQYVRTYQWTIPEGLTPMDAKGQAINFDANKDNTFFTSGGVLRLKATKEVNKGELKVQMKRAGEVENKGYGFENGINTEASGTILITAIANEGLAQPAGIQQTGLFKAFEVTIEGNPLVLDDDPVSYVAKLESITGIPIDVSDYTFEWKVSNNGVEVSQNKDNINIKWVGDGTVSVTLTGKLAGFTITRSAELKVARTKLLSSSNSNIICADIAHHYELEAPPTPSILVEWEVEHGMIKKSDGTFTQTLSVQSNEKVEIIWQGGDNGEGAIELITEINDKPYLYRQAVFVSKKPANLNFKQAQYTYCKNGSPVILTPAIKKEADGTIMFYKVNKGGADEVINQEFVPADGENEVEVYYAYTIGKCSYESSHCKVLTFSTSPVDFTIKNSSTITKTDTTGNQPITFCSTNADTTSKIILKLSGNTPTSGGKFEVTNSSTHQQVGGLIEVDKGETSVSLDYSLLAVGGVFTITYTLNESCAQSVSRNIRVLARVSNLDIQLTNGSENETNRSFCVSHTKQYSFALEQPANIVTHKGDFYIRRASGTHYTADDFASQGFVKITGFDPQNPMGTADQPSGGGVSIIQQNANAGQYDVVYVYQYIAGENDKKYPCRYISDVLTVSLERLPILTIEGLQGAYCHNESKGSIEVFDQGNQAGDSVLVLTQLEYKSGDAWVKMPGNDPTKLAAAIYEVRATHTNNAGCTNKSKIKKVKVSEEPTGFKAYISKVYHEQAMHFVAVEGSRVKNWDWMIDGVATSARKAKHIPNRKSDNISYSLTASTELCQASLQNEFRLDFDFEGHCVGGGSTLTNHSVIRTKTGQNELGEVTWTIADKDGHIIETLNGTSQHINYFFPTAGEYWITLTMVNKAQNVTYELKRRVDIFDLVIVTKGANYLETFENGAKSWVSRGVVTQNQAFVGKTSWRLKRLSNAHEDVIKGNQGMVWMTDNGSAPHYYNNEQSYVESPCFDLSDLDKPMVSLRYWSHTDSGADGVVLLYTLDDGKSWRRVGNKARAIEGWYNDRGILGAPGSASSIEGTNANEGNQGWTGTDSTWRTTAYNLSNVRQEMLAQNTSRVRFRIAFGSNNDNPSARYEGFAFDNFGIGNRNRTLLLEYFTNNKADNAVGLDKEVKFFPYANDSTHAEIISIHHHVGFPGVDELNEYNTKDASGRAFYHGIKSAPTAVIDGLNTHHHPHNEVSSLFYEQRVLSVSPFKVVVAPTTTDTGTLRIKTKITALEKFDRKVVIQVAVIEDEVVSEDNVYHNVMRKMLPDAAGTYYDHSWKPGDAYDLDLRWNVNDLPMKSYRVVVFVEDYVTKEVHQAAVSTVQTLHQGEGQADQGVTGLNHQVVRSGVLLFPNPANDEVQLKLHPNQQLKSQAAWEVSTIHGQIVDSGVWRQHQRGIRVKVGRLIRGVYLVRVFDAERIFFLRFEKK